MHKLECWIGIAYDTRMPMNAWAARSKGQTLQRITTTPKCFCFSSYIGTYEVENGAFKTVNASIPLFFSANAAKTF